MVHGFMMHGHDMPHWWGAGWGVVGVIWMILLLAFWALVLAGLVLLVRWLWLKTREPKTASTALEILKTRYARGELSRQEFGAIKQDLEG